MKKILIAVLAALAAYNAYAIRFDAGGHSFESSSKNTSASERPMSPYKKGSVVFFRNDTAYMFHPTAEMEVGDLTVCQELMGLGIEGTFAYDEAGNKLYFSKKSDRGNELYEATYVGGKWTNIRKMQIKGVMTNIKYEKNSALPVARWRYKESPVVGFYNPTLSKNGERVYFSGDFKAGKGDRDIWYIDLEEDSWSYPENVSQINTECREDFAFLVGDSILIYATSCPGKKGGLNLYAVNKSGDEWGKPEELTDVNSDADDYNLIFIGDVPYFISNRSGGKGGTDIYCIIPLAPEKEPELLAEITLAEPKEFHWVLFYFDFDKSNVKREDAEQMDELAAAMKEFPEASFQIDGHTDIRGSDPYNMALSGRRAEFVKSMLIDRGIPSNKMNVVPHGKRQLSIPNAKNEAEHEQNRRVEVNIVNQ